MISVTIEAISVDDACTSPKIRSIVRHNGRVVFVDEETYSLEGGAKLKDALLYCAERAQNAMDKLIS